MTPTDFNREVTKLPGEWTVKTSPYTGEMLEAFSGGMTMCLLDNGEVHACTDTVEARARTIATARKRLVAKLREEAARLSALADELED